MPVMLTREADTWEEGVTALLALLDTTTEPKVREHCRAELVRMGQVLDHLEPVVRGAVDRPDPPKVPL